jgi:hypothetical protein
MKSARSHDSHIQNWPPGRGSVTEFAQRIRPWHFAEVARNDVHINK